MGIIVPNSTPITLAADLTGGEYYQTFTLADTTGTRYSAAYPLPVNVTVTGYDSITPYYQGSFLPLGGVYITDLTGTDFNELIDGQAATVRINDRRALMTASDGQVTTLVESLGNNYHDTVVASGSTFTGVVTAAYPSFFRYTASNTKRYVYIPLSKSGWKSVSIYIKQSLVKDLDSTAANINITFYADFGQFIDDVPIYSDTISGIAGSNIGRAYTCYDTVYSGSSAVYIPEFNSPLAGVIIAITTNESSTGNIEIYASKGS